MGMMEGGCLCGEIRYRVGGDCGVTHCHCIHCRKLGGPRIRPDFRGKTKMA